MYSMLNFFFFFVCSIFHACTVQLAAGVADTKDNGMCYNYVLEYRTVLRYTHTCTHAHNIHGCVYTYVVILLLCGTGLY